MINKPWLKQPGECHDKRGIPIYPGDLLRMFHYRAARRRQIRYLYFVAVYDTEAKAMRLIPASFLEATIRDDKDKRVGKLLLSDTLVSNSDVISGTGPDDLMDYDERPRVPVEESR